MQDIETLGHCGALSGEVRRPIEAPQPARAEVVYLDPLKIDRAIERHIAINRPIHTCGQYMDFVTCRGQTAAQGVDGIDWTTVAICRDIRRRNMEKAHSECLALRGAIPIRSWCPLQNLWEAFVCEQALVVGAIILEQTY